MKYIELVENLNATRVPFTKSLVTRIKKECSQIIEIYDKAQHTLLRGTEFNWKAFHASIRTDRKPITKDLISLQDAIHDAFIQLGSPTTRQNCLFTTSYRGLAAHYGTLYIIYPKNGFKYTWINKTPGDFNFFTITKVLDNLTSNDADSLWQSNKNQWIKDNYNLFVDKLKTKLKSELVIDRNLIEAIDGLNEVLISGTDYFAIRADAEDLFLQIQS